MRNLEIQELEKISGDGCGIAIFSFVASVASVAIAPATGFASLIVSQAAIVASTYSMAESCTND